MGDYGETGREYDESAHQADPTPEADAEAVVYATEPTGEIETVSVAAAVRALTGDGEEAVRPDGGGQTQLSEWGQP